MASNVTTGSQNRAVMDSAKVETPSKKSLSSNGSLWRWVVWGGMFTRVLISVVSEWNDSRYDAEVRYTDVDYIVFTDAAREVWQGNSPYDRATYRYTPVLSWLLLPNVLVRVWGKLVFCAADLIIGVLLYRILVLRGTGPRGAAAYAAAFLCHPFTINVSSRGNADSIVCVAVLMTLYLLLKGRDLAAAVAFAVAVHIKIYPIIYALPIVLFLDAAYAPADFALPGVDCFASRVAAAGSRFGFLGQCISNSASWLVQFLTWRRLRFGIVSGGLFIAATAVLYGIYGYTFLYETYLYHLVRTDNRHNFSPYFYDLYLRYDDGGSVASASALGNATSASTATTAATAAGGAMAARTLSGILAFLPQLGTLTALGAAFYRDLPFALLVQTMVFVAWNKVITVQYFHWYLCLLPLVLAQSTLSARAWLGSFLVWLLAELHWNFWALHLELRGQSVFLEVWAAGLVFLAVNIVIIIVIIQHHRYLPVLLPPSTAARQNASASLVSEGNFEDRIACFPAEWLQTLEGPWPWEEKRGWEEAWRRLWGTGRREPAELVGSDSASTNKEKAV